MGACYSKNSSLSSPKDHGQKPKRRSFRKSKTPETETSPCSENERLMSNGGSSSVKPASQYVEVAMGDDHKVGAPPAEVSRSSTPVLEVDEDMLNQLALSVEKGVAPSDSGIESIGLAPEEGQFPEVVRRESTSRDLAKRLERLSRGSCHKCGNFKLDDNVLTALLADTYCLCGPRLAGRPAINPDCRTHGTRKQRPNNSSNSGQSEKSSSDEKRVQKELRFVEDNNTSPLSHFHRNKSKVNSSEDSENKDPNARLSIHSTGSVDLALAILSTVENGSRNNNTSDSNTKVAPLAACDSIDNILKGPTTHGSARRLSTGSRKSLLSEILDITNSICKCDFYSNEFHCSVNHSAPATNGNEISTNRSRKPLCSEDVAMEIVSPKKNVGLQNVSTNSFDSPSRKSGSLPKNVSFAKDPSEAGKADSRFSTPSRSVSRSNRNSVTQPEGSESSGVFTYSFASEPLLHNGHGDSPKRPVSLGSKATLMSDDSESEVFEGTEEDMRSLDLDSLSRVTSLSYSSIKQLVESTEDLCAPLDTTARRMNIEGVDCVVIPTEAYRQMQGELASLRQQLLSLAYLMQEVGAFVNQQEAESDVLELSAEDQSDPMRMKLEL